LFIFLLHPEALRAKNALVAVVALVRKNNNFTSSFL